MQLCCFVSLQSHLLRAASSPTVPLQARSVYLTFHKMDGAMQHLQSNPFYNKYESKIKKIAEQHPSAVVKAVADRRAAVAAEAQDPVAAAAGVRRLGELAPRGKEPLKGATVPLTSVKKLDSVMRVELLQNKTAEEIGFLWTEHWRHFPGICGVVKADQYKLLHNTGKDYHMFMYPLPREKGFDFVVGQFAGHEIHFTQLINYQKYKENSPECLSLIHFTDLSHAKGIVLMRGVYDTKIMSGREAEFLVNQMQLYYSGQDAEKTKLLKEFHRSPETFDHMSLIKELDKLDLGCKPQERN